MFLRIFVYVCLHEPNEISESLQHKLCCYYNFQLNLVRGMFSLIGKSSWYD